MTAARLCWSATDCPAAEESGAAVVGRAGAAGAVSCEAPTATDRPDSAATAGSALLSKETVPAGRLTAVELAEGRSMAKRAIERPLEILRYGNPGRHY